MTESEPGKVKIAIVGSRGIPARYGGFETFAEEISLFLSGHGIEVTVQCDPGSYHQKSYSGVNLFFSTVRKSSNQFQYYLEGIKWGVKNADILLVTGNGGSPFYLYKPFRKKILVTNADGLEHRRGKWSYPVRLFFKLAERLSVNLSDYIIADSSSIHDYLLNTYRISPDKIRTIEYGACLNETFMPGILEKYSLKHKSYYLIVARLEPENNLHIILEAYLRSGSRNPLIVVGNVLNTRYLNRIRRKYGSERIRYLGGIYDRNKLAALRISCKAYFHGHSVGGTNPSLLEALANGNVVICHDNPFNREVAGPQHLYFGSVDECKQRIKEIEAMDPGSVSCLEEISRKRISEYYNWGNIGNKYLLLIQEIARKSRKDC